MPKSRQAWGIFKKILCLAKRTEKSFSPIGQKELQYYKMAYMASMAETTRQQKRTTIQGHHDWQGPPGQGLLGLVCIFQNRKWKWRQRQRRQRQRRQRQRRQRQRRQQPLCHFCACFKSSSFTVSCPCIST